MKKNIFRVKVYIKVKVKLYLPLMNRFNSETHATL